MTARSMLPVRHPDVGEREVTFHVSTPAPGIEELIQVLLVSGAEPVLIVAARRGGVPIGAMRLRRSELAPLALAIVNAQAVPPVLGETGTRQPYRQPHYSFSVKDDWRDGAWCGVLEVLAVGTDGNHRAPRCYHGERLTQLGRALDLVCSPTATD